MRPVLGPCTLVLAAGLAPSGFAATPAQDPEVTVTRLAAQTSAGDRSGTDLDADAGRVAVGAPFRTTGGAVLVLDLETGLLVADLALAAPGLTDQLGRSVAISGDVVVAGTDRGTDGSAVVFDLVSGQPTFELLPTSTHDPESFGSSVDVDGRTAAVGSRFWEPAGPSNHPAGAVYLFDTLTGAQLAEITQHPDASVAWLGHSVAIDGDRVAAGAPLSDGGGTDRGAAFLYDAADGSLVAELVPPAPIDGALLGSDVAIGGGLVAVLAPWEDDGSGTAVGAVHVFDAATGAWLRRIEVPGETFGVVAGRRIAVSGGRLAVGGPQNDVGALVDAGTVFVFDLATGALLHEVVEQWPYQSARFGRCLAMTADRLVHGNWADDAHGTDSGVVRAFELPVVLDGGPGALSLSAGGTQTWTVTSGPSQAGNGYLLVGSLAPPGGGTPLGAGPHQPVVPLTFDAFTVYCVDTAGSNGLYAGQLGLLDGTGSAAGSFTLPPGTSAAFAGLTLRHACVVVDPTPSALTPFVDRASNALALQLTP